MQGLLISFVLFGSVSAWALDCSNIVVSPLPANEVAHSVYCVASFYTGKDFNGRMIQIASLGWPLGNAESACQELNDVLEDPRAELVSCHESQDLAVQP
jgi:hypothetical protein